MTHTPGPWIAENCENGTPKESTLCTVAWIEDWRVGFETDRPGGNYRDSEFAHAAADARLIAAAPALYEGLREIWIEAENGAKTVSLNAWLKAEAALALVEKDET